MSNIVPGEGREYGRDHLIEIEQRCLDLAMKIAPDLPNLITLEVVPMKEMGFAVRWSPPVASNWHSYAVRENYVDDIDGACQRAVDSLREWSIARGYLKS